MRAAQLRAEELVLPLPIFLKHLKTARESYAARIQPPNAPPIRPNSTITNDHKQSNPVHCESNR